MIFFSLNASLSVLTFSLDFVSLVSRKKKQKKKNKNNQSDGTVL